MSPITVIEARNYLAKGMQPHIYREEDEFPIDREGAVNQRRWMVVDAASRVFRSQRHPGWERLAVIRPSLDGDTLQLRAEGFGSIAFPVEEEGERTVSTIWEADSETIVHHGASQWLSDFLGKKALFVRKGSPRPINSIYAPEHATVGFADRFPLTMLSEETGQKICKSIGEDIDIARFRYNLLLSGCAAQDENRMERLRIGNVVLSGVKPCGRCTTINVNQQTGEMDADLLEKLREHPDFRNPHTKEVIVSENAIVEQPGSIRIGSPVEILQWREEGWDRVYRKGHQRQKTVRGTWNALRSFF